MVYCIDKNLLTGGNNMFTDKIFETALYIESPWFIDKIDFDLDEKRLDIFINFTKGSMFIVRFI